MKEIKVDCMLYLKVEENVTAEEAIDLVLSRLVQNTDLDINVFDYELQEV